ncbi:hypothetical protein FRC06_004398 [Ceratobasidium sp. 370]|nr:hypothetical protein FRC06_004398 [Ceratobasidium sp. 370]
MSDNTDELLPFACVNCGHRDALVKCTQCPVTYCTQSEENDDTACLTQNPDVTGGFRCRACHNRVHEGGETTWPAFVAYDPLSLCSAYDKKPQDAIPDQAL